MQEGSLALHPQELNGLIGPTPDKFALLDLAGSCAKRKLTERGRESEIFS
jgi:hypothetical protein